MKNISVITCFLLIALALVSCFSRKPSQSVVIENTKTITEVVKDTIYKIEADSSFYNAYVDCVNGIPVLITNEMPSLGTKTLLKPKSGKYLEVPKVNLQNGLLTVNCEAKAQELFKQWREKYINENSKETATVYVEKPLKWFQKLLMWTGVLWLCLIGINIIKKFIK